MGSSNNGRAVGLAALRRAIEAADAARAARHLDEVASDLLAIEASGAYGELGRTAERARAVQRLERLAAGQFTARTDVGSLLERLATLHLLASRSIARMVTSLPCLWSSGEFARGLMVVLCELVHVLEETARDGRTLQCFLTLARQDGDLVLAIAAQGAADAPAPTIAAARALDRARRIVGLLGGSVGRGVRDGMMVIGVVVDATTVDGSDGGGALGSGR